MLEALCRQSSTTLDIMHAEDGPPITQRTSGLGVASHQFSRKALSLSRRCCGGEQQTRAGASLILDVRLPGVSRLNFQAELAKADTHFPIIFISGRAMKTGAIEFLTKPFRDRDLLDAVQFALQRDRDRRIRESAVWQTRAHFEASTSREQEVFSLVTAGLMNKQVAGELGVSEITAKMHRGNVMRKMGARSLADFVRMADALGIRQAKH